LIFEADSSVKTELVQVRVTLPDAWLTLNGMAFGGAGGTDQTRTQSTRSDELPPVVNGVPSSGQPPPSA
jgi:hypothetical protein